MLDELSMGLALIVVRRIYELVTELATRDSRFWSSNRSPVRPAHCRLGGSVML